MTPALEVASDVLIVEPGDRRLAMLGVAIDRAAWFEDQLKDGPIYIVVTRAATDTRLAALGKHFGVPLDVLTAFRDGLPA